MLTDDDLITGLDYALRQGFDTHSAWIFFISRKYMNDGVISQMWSGQTKGKKVDARIDFERWIADCPDPLCMGSEMVCLEDKLFFCISCGNASNDFHAYPVMFPSPGKRKLIYVELNKRPQHRLPRQNRIRAVETARPMFAGLGRSWNPDETIGDLKKQRSIYPKASSRKTEKVPARTIRIQQPRNDSEKGGKI